MPRAQPMPGRAPGRWTPRRWTTVSSESKFHLWQPTWRDLRAVMALERLCFERDAWPWIDVLAALSLPAGVRRGAQIEDILVGFVLGERRDRGQTGWIASLAVHPGYRRRGIGRELLAVCELELGTPRLRLALRRSNQAALQLYRNAGYAYLETWKGYYPDGEDGWIMGKETPPPTASGAG
jgi:ribosomal-protein-alanine N-acetyltransferase